MFLITAILLLRFFPISNLTAQFRFYPLLGLIFLWTACDNLSDLGIGDKSGEEVRTNADEMPEFKGGNAKLIEFISKNVRYPANAKDMKLAGAVHVSFVVQKDGSIAKVEIEKGVYSDLNDEAIRVVKSMPKWIPAKHEGKKVAVKLILPIRFELPKDEDKKK